MKLTLSVVLPFLLIQFAAQAKSEQRSQVGTVLWNPTPDQKILRPTIVMARNANGSIQAAINSQPVGPVQIYISCGVYTENIVITTSDVRILGEERQCVQIQPANPALPVITIDATNSGTAGIHADEVSDLTISCPTGTHCSDGLKIMGRLDINQPNDFHKFSRLAVYGTFQNGINLAGRTIWTEFENLEVEFALGNGINVVSSGVTNALTFRNVRSAWNNGYGIYVNNTQIDLAQGLLFDTVNAEYNGRNTNLANCAGIYLTGVVQANIENSYFEGNCQGNTADNRAAEMRVGGTYAHSVNIIDSAFNLQYGEGGIYNDAFLTTGTYQGNKFDTTTNNFTIYVATSHPASNVVLGENFNSNPTIVPDGNGLTHVRMLSPFAFDYVPVTSVTGNSIDVTTVNGVNLYYGPYTINSFTGGHIGQLLYVTAVNVNGQVLINSAGGPGQIVFPDGLNRTLNVGESIMLYYDGTSWHPIESNVTSQPRYTATIITSGASADQVAVPGITAAAHCVFSARNAIAAGLSGMYLTTATGTVTLNHTALDGGLTRNPQAVPGAIYDVFCSSN
ncbi:MAG: hypothetical protein ACLPY1_03740 [Terracidiphilus sp.]